MTYTSELLEELKILRLFNLSTTQEGIKVHSSAEPDAIAATRRLFEKGLVTQEDGGYLTTLGHDAAQHAQDLLTILNGPITVG
ncbi:TIGR02647 family protein [Halomonas sp. ML-15]|uniref:TIGR02647 family protein n=1 Tax=Halomonas sp. ML-15 TaxID=2773305 RepID=UPI00174645AB|nr:TIGR02647 family protein [Halomonas sp. ML-15]MBD3897734.1 TIGR02647 family protein [Halomonas sp. ML-15]